MLVQQRGACGGQQRPAAGDARCLGCEVPTARQDRAHRAIGDRAPVGQQDDAVGDLSGELGIVGGDDDRAAPPVAKPAKRWSAPPWRRGPCHVSARRGRSPRRAPRSRGRLPAPAAGAGHQRGHADGGRAAGRGRRRPARRARPRRRRAHAAGSRWDPGAGARRGRRLRILPRVGSIRPAAWRKMVDLPAPLRPMSATRSPARDRQVDATQDHRAHAALVPTPPKLSAASRRSRRAAPPRARSPLHSTPSILPSASRDDRAAVIAVQSSLDVPEGLDSGRVEVDPARTQGSTCVLDA